MAASTPPDAGQPTPLRRNDKPCQRTASRTGGVVGHRDGSRGDRKLGRSCEPRRGFRCGHRALGSISRCRGPVADCPEVGRASVRVPDDRHPDAADLTGGLRGRCRGVDHHPIRPPPGRPWALHIHRASRQDRQSHAQHGLLVLRGGWGRSRRSDGSPGPAAGRGLQHRRFDRCAASHVAVGAPDRAGLSTDSPVAAANALQADRSAGNDRCRPGPGGGDRARVRPYRRVGTRRPAPRVAGRHGSARVACRSMAAYP